MKTLVFLVVSTLAGTLLAGTGGYTVVGQDTPCVPCETVQAVATVKIQDAVVTWEPKVEYQEREVQLQVPPQIRLQSVPTVSSQSVQTITIPAAPTATSTYQIPQVQMQYQTPQVMTYSQTTTQACTAPQTVTYQTSPQTQICVNGQCLPPQMPSPNRHVIEYQPAQVGVNGVPIKTMNTPIRTRGTIRKALRNPPATPSPGSQSFR